MLDQDKSKQQLIDELAETRRRVAVLETADTDHKQAEEALREAGERFRKVFEEGPIGILLVCTDGRILHTNQHFCDMLGYSEHEIIALGLKGITHPDDWKRDHPIFLRLWQGEISHYHAEKRYLCRNGRVLWAQMTISLLRDKTGRPMNTVGMVEDITVRKQAEEALRESEERFNLFMDNSPAIAWMKDEQGRYIYINKSYGSRIGVRPEDWIGKMDCEVWPLATAELFRKNDEKVLVSGQVVEFVEESTKPDGNRRYCWNFKFPFQDSTGRRFVGGVGVDITERKQAEEALQKAHDELEKRIQERTAELTKANETLAYLASFPEKNPHPIIEVGLGGDVRYVNPAAQSLFPELREQGQKHPWLGDWEVAVHQLGEGRTETAIQEVAVADRWYQQVFCYLAQDQVVRIYGLDVSERKQAEEKTRQNRELLQAIIDNTPALIYVKDLEGRVTIANRALCEAVGRDMQDLLGKSSRDVVADLRDAEIHMANDRRVLETGQAIQAEESSFGRVFLSVKFPLKNAQGHVFAIGGVSTDITERKQAEEALRKEHRNLKHLLQSSDHERQLIAYEIHDGLAQQLAGAIMQIQAFAHLKDKHPKKAAKAYDAGLTMLQQGHFEARRLISGVRPPILDEAGVVEAIAHLVHEQSRSTGQKIDSHSRVVFDRLDPTLENAVYRIVQEALTNACKYSKSERIWVSLLQREDTLRIEIRDWGVGFDPKAVPKNHFGLEGIRQRARLLGGKCSIRSKAGKGTRVMVELPVVLGGEDE